MTHPLGWRSRQVDGLPRHSARAVTSAILSRPGRTLRSASSSSSSSRSSRGQSVRCSDAPVVPGVARSILSRPGVEGDMLSALKASEAFWRELRNSRHEPHRKGRVVVTRQEGTLASLAHGSVSPVVPLPPVAALPPSSSAPAPPPRYDVAVLGGTLGLMLACALQQRGFSVVVVEKRRAEGRNQEWNISRGEYQVLSEIGLLSAEELEATIVSEFNPVRVGFKGGRDLWVRDCLNLGVRPKALLQLLRDRFEAAGGTVLEGTAFRSALVADDGVRLRLAPGGAAAPLHVGDTNRPTAVRVEPVQPPAQRSPATGGSNIGPAAAACAAAAATLARPSPPREVDCRLVLDCMGHYSDIVKQMRGHVKPDGMVMVVGSCASGFPAALNTSGDLLYSLTDAEDDMQFFWEAFPAEGGAARTTYMFAYTDAQPSRPSFESLLDTYFAQLPRYQGGISLDKLTFKRVLFGGFPCYADSPLKPAFDRVLQVGDASCGQSPLSFGGFGSLVRHLPRLAQGLEDALVRDRLSRSDLGWLQPYQPSLSAAWLFQRSMSIGVGQLQRGSDGGTAGGTAAAGGEAAVAFAATEGAARAPARGAAAAHGGGGGGGGGGARPDAAGGGGGLPGWARLPVQHVNAVLATNFEVMRLLGDRVVRPFLQDTIQALPLTLTMTGMMLRNPVVICRVLGQVGAAAIAAWFAHFVALVTYTVLHLVAAPLLRPLARHSYTLSRLLDAWRYGSGSDHVHHPPSPAPPTASTLAPATAFVQAAEEQQSPKSAAAALGIVTVSAAAAVAVVTAAAAGAEAEAAPTPAGGADGGAEEGAANSWRSAAAGGSTFVSA